MLNDFEAIGYGVPVVPEGDLLVLHDAPVQPQVLPLLPHVSVGLNDMVSNVPSCMHLNLKRAHVLDEVCGAQGYSNEIL